MLLTGVLVFVAPQSWVQAAMACIFAFGILLGFELMRPHLDPADAWLYRLVREKTFRWHEYFHRCSDASGWLGVLISGSVIFMWAR